MGSLPIALNKKKISTFCKKHHIATLALFGSILTAHYKPTSDLDMLVNFERNYVPSLFDLVDMESELSLIVGKPVDLKTVNDLSPYFREEVVEQAKIIYG